MGDLARLVLGRQHAIWPARIVRGEDWRARRRHIGMRAVWLGWRDRRCGDIVSGLAVVVFGLEGDGAGGSWRRVCVIVLRLLLVVGMVRLCNALGDALLALPRRRYAASRRSVNHRREEGRVRLLRHRPGIFLGHHVSLSAHVVSDLF